MPDCEGEPVESVVLAVPVPVPVALVPLFVALVELLMTAQTPFWSAFAASCSVVVQSFKHLVIASWNLVSLQTHGSWNDAHLLPEDAMLDPAQFNTHLGTWLEDVAVLAVDVLVREGIPEGNVSDGVGSIPAWTEATKRARKRVAGFIGARRKRVCCERELSSGRVIGGKVSVEDGGIFVCPRAQVRIPTGLFHG